VRRINNRRSLEQMTMERLLPPAVLHLLHFIPFNVALLYPSGSCDFHCAQARARDGPRSMYIGPNAFQSKLSKFAQRVGASAPSIPSFPMDAQPGNDFPHMPTHPAVSVPPFASDSVRL
jgi:hypothetical protein